jgi:type I restriction enzyme, S subunit
VGLRPGYKLTEVGVIPEEWATATISKLGTVVRGGSPRPAGDPRYFNGSFVPWLTVAALTNIPESNLHVSETVSFLTEEGSKRSRTVQSGTVIIANSGATLGVAKILSMTCCANDGVAALIGQTKGEKRFLCYYLNSQTKRLREVVATGNGQPNLNTTLIGDIVIPLPSDDEQRAIAEALGDTDALIGALDRLIAKKRDLKQAATQQLLTGKRRLPGYGGRSGFKRTEGGVIPADWDYDTLGGKTIKIGSGITPTGGERVYRQSGRPFVRSQNVGWGHLVMDDIAFIDDETHRSFSATEIEVGDVFLNITGASIGRSAVSDCRVWAGNVSQHVCIIRPEASELDSLFLNSFLLSSTGQRQIDSFQAGGNRQGLNFGQISSFGLPLPPLPEQTAIAAVLSDVGAEITALEKKRHKTYVLKQGMMQELLTGRVRLV